MDWDDIELEDAIEMRALVAWGTLPPEEEDIYDQYYWDRIEGPVERVQRWDEE